MRVVGKMCEDTVATSMASTRECAWVAEIGYGSEVLDLDGLCRWAQLPVGRCDWARSRSHLLPRPLDLFMDVMKLLINKVNKNDRNSEGLTALDIVSWLPQEVDKKEVEHIFCHAGAKNASSSSLPAIVFTLADLLSRPEGFNERWLRYVINRQRKISSDLRNVILVVAVLVATASYQTVLNPPGGVGQGKSVMAKGSFFVFAFLNSTAFVAAMAVIVVVLHINYFSLLLHLALFFLMSSYVVSLFVISPLTNMAAKLFVVGPRVFLWNHSLLEPLDFRKG
ncbi:hypothetical protein F0562_007903 [Nyssa sinensis]|uniref:PGG domain-containing protein n=1 Tax=Nyssa sinensis TaxID=561372 RepID=A0A5J5A9B8_9ASTE|nr:hypothetical protein F0562_007903 [Nyssa sinensis]